MTTAIDHNLDTILAEWHQWKSGYQIVKGYSSDSSTRMCHSPTHWDWLNGAEDERAERELMKAFDEAVDSVPRPWHLAICIEARNLCNGIDNWNSPMIPQSRQEREILVMEARTKLLQQIHQRGLSI